jgi:hypothetical protein
MGIDGMAMSHAGRRASQKLLARLLPELSAASAETLEILMDVEQVSTLLASFDEVCKGQVVSFQQAFSDL